MELLDSLKNAWIQYISFFVLIFAVVYRVILGYAFEYNVLENSIVSDLVPKNATQEQKYKMRSEWTNLIFFLIFSFLTKFLVINIHGHFGKLIRYWILSKIEFFTFNDW